MELPRRGFRLWSRKVRSSAMRLLVDGRKLAESIFTPMVKSRRESSTVATTQATATTPVVLRSIAAVAGRLLDVVN